PNAEPERTVRLRQSEAKDRRTIFNERSCQNSLSHLVTRGSSQGYSTGSTKGPTMLHRGCPSTERALPHAARPSVIPKFPAAARRVRQVGGARESSTHPRFGAPSESRRIEGLEKTARRRRASANVRQTERRGERSEHLPRRAAGGSVIAQRDPL